MTGECLVLLMELAAERTAARTEAEFDRMVSAVQVGTVIAHDPKQLARWNSRRRGKRGLTGAELEAAVMALARRNPEYVVVEAA